jgi:hypothetical protein
VTATNATNVAFYSMPGAERHYESDAGRSGSPIFTNSLFDMME